MGYIGIDPGISGAVALVGDNGEFVSVEDIPVMANGKGKAKVKSKVNSAGLVELFINMPESVVYLERISAMPGQGVASMFSMGHSSGCIEGVLGALKKPLNIITPQSWKKHFGLPSDKEVCRAKAIELFPSAPLSRKKDHNRAEALLIARYAYEIGGRST